jgi:hypothetical protein
MPVAADSLEGYIAGTGEIEESSKGRLNAA